MPHSLAEAQASARQYYNQPDRREPVEELKTMCMDAIKQADTELHAFLKDESAQHWAVVLVHHNITAIHTLAYKMFGDNTHKLANLDHVPAETDGLWAAAHKKLEVLAHLHEVIDENGQGKDRAVAVMHQFGTRDDLCKGTYHAFSSRLGRMGILSDSDMHNVLTGVRARHSKSLAVRRELWEADIDQNLADTLEKWGVASVKNLTREQYDELRLNHITHKDQRVAFARIYTGDEGGDGAAARNAANNELVKKMRAIVADVGALRDAGHCSEADRHSLYNRVRELGLGSAPLHAAASGCLSELVHELHVIEAALKKVATLRTPEDMGKRVTDLSDGMAQRGVLVGGRQPAGKFLNPERYVDPAPPPAVPVQLDRRRFVEERSWQQYKRANEKMGPSFATSVGDSPIPEGTDPSFDDRTSGVLTGRLTVHIAAFDRSPMNMVMSEDAIRDACAVTDVDKGTLYLNKYGSHVPRGVHTVGAELTRVATATSTDPSASIDTLLAQADSKMSWDPAKSDAFARGRSLNDILGTSTDRVWTEAITRGPDDVEPSAFLQKLDDASTWCLLDRGDPARMEPVWSIMGRSKELVVKQAAPHVRDAWIAMMSAQRDRLPPWIAELLARARNEAGGVGDTAPSTVEESVAKLDHLLQCLFVAEHGESTDAARACTMAEHLVTVFGMVKQADYANASHSDFLARMLNGTALQMWIRAAARSIGPISHHRGAVARALQATLTPEFRKEALERNDKRVTELLQEEAVHELLEWSVEEEESGASARENAPHVLHTHDELCAEVRQCVRDRQTPLDQRVVRLGALLSHNVRQTTIDMLEGREKLMRIEVCKVLEKTYTLMQDGFHSPLNSDHDLGLLSGDLERVTLPINDNTVEADIKPTGTALDGGVYARNDWAQHVSPPTGIKYRVDRIPSTAGGAALCDALLRRLPLTPPVEEFGGPALDEAAAVDRLVEYMRVCDVPRQFQEAAMQVLGVGGPGRLSPARAP